MRSAATIKIVSQVLIVSSLEGNHASCLPLMLLSWYSRGALLAVLITNVVILILVSRMVQQQPVPHAASNKCNDGNPCTADLVVPYGYGLLGGEYCDPRPLVASTPCTSTCHASGTRGSQCDGMGECGNSNQTTCNGYCGAGMTSVYWEDDSLAADNAIFPLKVYFLNALFPADNVGAALLAGGLCVANEWRFVVIQPVFSTWDNRQAWTFHEGALEPCSFLLNDTLVDVNRCIESKEFDLDSTFMQEYMDANIGTSDDVPPSYRMRGCVFKYACSQQNVTLLSDPVNFAISNISQTLFKMSHRVK